MRGIGMNLTVILPALVFFGLTACSRAGEPPSAAGPESGPAPAGEEIVYAIKKMGMKAGRASLTFTGETDLEGRPALLVVFRAEALNFYDEERIFLDPSSYLPRRVERDLNIFGKKEKITEIYDQEKGEVRIVKHNGGDSEEVLAPGGPLENIYGFIYRQRQSGKFAVGDSFEMQLPTRQMILSVEKVETVKAGGQKREAYFLQSDPGKYKIWLGTDEARIPLRIDGAVGFGNTMMIMDEYLPEGKAGRLAKEDEAAS